MRYKLRHLTAYDYAEPVDLASHMLHLSPRALPWQSVSGTRIICDPVPARTSEAVDHFGNRVTWIFIDEPHDHLRVTAEAEVEVAFPTAPPPEATPPWEEVVAQARAGGPQAWRATEFTFAGPMVATDQGAGAYVAQSFTPGRPILEALIEVNGRIKTDFAFRPLSTTITTSVARVLAQRAGVCQDFAHLMIAGLRTLGLPARYTSGYIRTYSAPGKPRRVGADVSHAWVGCWLGEAHGWLDFDPTNNLIVQEEHVVLGWGREFGDVSPLRGIILGGGEHDLTVSVDLEPLGD
ncbi:transglutaminase family protein [Acidisoma cladoniae]|jgi:transglutaminase-like putative cysteine protease|uniref:transglutaminase family protein n=1 Tax=Acidisoma cladoniae TaxID=3040935 RepID=UPI00254DB4CE|nr:transglutaminase family protein [Acidisoma sp. PAMC 29798]